MDCDNAKLKETSLKEREGPTKSQSLLVKSKTYQFLSDNNLWLMAKQLWTNDLTYNSTLPPDFYAIVYFDHFYKSQKWFRCNALPLSSQLGILFERPAKVLLCVKCNNTKKSTIKQTFLRYYISQNIEWFISIICGSSVVNLSFKNVSPWCKSSRIC